jgi:hypothetical protein
MDVVAAVVTCTPGLVSDCSSKGRPRRGARAATMAMERPLGITGQHLVELMNT